MSAEKDLELAALRRDLAAKEKMLKVLISRAERDSGVGAGALDKLRGMHELEQRVASKTFELEAESAKLLDTLLRLHQTQEQLVQAQKLEAIGQLAAGIAHDFNNLLTIILGNSDFLMQALPEEGAENRQAGQISRAGKKAAALTRQLLAFSRKQTLLPEVLDLNRLVQHEKDMLQRLIGEDIDFVAKLGPDIGFVRFDPTQIEQIIMNLVLNARDAMPQGGTLTIKTSKVNLEEVQGASLLGRQRPSVLLSVSDTGSGMDAETKSKIFEPFFTTKGPGKGTGLGLSTVYGIVKQSGGSIFVDSKPGRGTTFRIYLPSSQDALGAAEAPAPAPLAASTGTILLVEDDGPVRSITRAILESSGYKVLDTGDSGEALRLCLEHGAGLDLLLTDIVMPKKNGPILAQEILAMSPAMKVVYMTGYFDSSKIELSEEVPAASIVRKPFSSEGLVSKVREALALRPLSTF